MDLTPEQRELARALAELERRKEGDALQHFDPYPSQEQFLRSQALYKLVRAGNRAGKSQVGAADIAHTMRGTHPYQPNYDGGVYVLIAPSRAQIMATWQKKLLEDCEMQGHANKPFIPAWEIEDTGYDAAQGQKSLRYVKMKNGKELMIMVSGTKQLKKLLKGRKLHGIWIDEDEGEGSMLDECYVRVQDVQSDPNCPGGGFIRWTSSFTKVNDSLDAFYERCMDEDDPDHVCFHIADTEVRHITDEVKQRLKRVLSEEQQAIRVTGHGSVTGDLKIYPQIDLERHTCSEKYQTNPDDCLFLGWDLGTGRHGSPAAMALGVCTRKNPKQLRLIAGWIGKNKTLEYQLAVMKWLLAGRKLASLIYDHGTGHKTEYTTGETVITTARKLMRKSGIYPIMGTRKHDSLNVSLGINIVRSMLDPKPDDPSVDPLLVWDPPDDDNNLRRGVYHLRMYRGKEETDATGAGGVVKKNNDWPDAVRYLCSVRPEWREGCQCGYGDGKRPAVGSELPAANKDPLAGLTQVERARQRREEQGRGVWKRSGANRKRRRRPAQ